MEQKEKNRNIKKGIKAKNKKEKLTKTEKWLKKKRKRMSEKLNTHTQKKQKIGIKSEK